MLHDLALKSLCMLYQVPITSFKKRDVLDEPLRYTSLWQHKAREQQCQYLMIFQQDGQNSNYKLLLSVFRLKKAGSTELLDETSQSDSAVSEPFFSSFEKYISVTYF